MKDDREQVLAQIRASLKTALLPDARATVPTRTAAGKGSRAEMIEQFRGELEPIGATSQVAANDEKAIEIVLNLLSKAEGKELLTWSDAELPVRGLGEALRGAGYARLNVDVPRDADGRKEKLLQLEHASAGITGAQAGLADTGSLALVTLPTRPRLASLLPPMHIALLPTARLFPTMAAFMEANLDVTRNASNLVFVTGPSRTADIELTLARGVHGPEYVHIVLLDWDEESH